MRNRHKRSLSHVRRLVFRFPGFIGFTAYTELIHVDVKRQDSIGVAPRDQAYEVEGAGEERARSRSDRAV
jgi:hypothetical protein